MWFIDEINQIANVTNVFTTVDVLIVLVIATVLSFIAAKTYQITHEGVSYSASFVHTLVMFGILVSMVMLIIGSNIARAFTLVGALSIVRFRNAIKETKDVGFIFFLMVIGMAVGTRFYILAIIMTIFVCVLMQVMHKTNYGQLKKEDFILKIIGVNVEDKAEPILTKHFAQQSLINIETTQTPNEKEFVFLVRAKEWNNTLSQQLLDELKNAGFNKVNIHGTDHLVY